LANHQDRQLPLFGLEQNKKKREIQIKEFFGRELEHRVVPFIHEEDSKHKRSCWIVYLFD
jgi:hypothetical protein